MSVTSSWISPYPELRITAVYALGNLRSPQAVSPLIKMLDDSNLWVRKCAAEAPGKNGISGKKMVSMGVYGHFKLFGLTAVSYY